MAKDKQDPTSVVLQVPHVEYVQNPADLKKIIDKNSRYYLLHTTVWKQAKKLHDSVEEGYRSLEQNIQTILSQEGGSLNGREIKEEPYNITTARAFVSEREGGTKTSYDRIKRVFAARLEKSKSTIFEHEKENNYDPFHLRIAIPYGTDSLAFIQIGYLPDSQGEMASAIYKTLSDRIKYLKKKERLKVTEYDNPVLTFELRGNVDREYITSELETALSEACPFGRYKLETIFTPFFFTTLGEPAKISPKLVKGNLVQVEHLKYFPSHVQATILRKAVKKRMKAVYGGISTEHQAQLRKEIGINQKTLLNLLQEEPFKIISPTRKKLLQFAGNEVKMPEMPEQTISGIISGALEDKYPDMEPTHRYNEFITDAAKEGIKLSLSTVRRSAEGLYTSYPERGLLDDIFSVLGLNINNFSNLPMQLSDPVKK